MTVAIGVQARFVVSNIDRDALAQAADDIMAFLVDAEDEYCIHSTAVSVDLGASAVVLEMISSAENYRQAELAARRAMEEAIKRTGGSPGDIDDPTDTDYVASPDFELSEQHSELVDA